MSVPSLPTDNLYKFMALAGLLLVILSIYYPAQRISDLQLKQVSVEVEVGIADLESTEIAEEISRLEKKESLTSNEVQSIASRNKQAKRNLIRLRGLANTQRILLSQLWFMLILGGLGALFGATLSLLGFRLWYVRVQCLADKVALASQQPPNNSFKPKPLRGSA